MIIKYKSKWHLSGRGDVYVIDLIENGISQYRNTFTETLLGKKVSIDNKQFKVTGIEAFAVAQGIKHTEIGLLVKPL